MLAVKPECDLARLDWLARQDTLDVLRERGRRDLPCTELYRQLFNPGLYLMAYGCIYANHGAMTPGVDGDTADGMSMGRIGRIVDAMRPNSVVPSTAPSPPGLRPGASGRKHRKIHNPV
jgi:hypothetical protein